MTASAARTVRIVLALTVALGLFLRLWRLDFGQELPYLSHTDEPCRYNTAVHMIRSSTPNPGFFRYPSLPMYIDACAMYAGYLTGRLAGRFESAEDLRPIRGLEMSVGLVGTPSMLLLGRAVSALFGALSVLLLYWLARELTQDAGFALLPALLLALDPGHIRLSHYMTVDVIATFFALGCVAAATNAVSRGSRRLLWLSAVLGGLATSSKYNYGALAVAVGLTALLYARSRWGHRVRDLLVCAGLFALAFALTSPFVLIDFEHASAGIRAEIRHYATGHLGVTGNSFAWYIGFIWRDNPALLLLGVPGLFSVWRRYGSRSAALLSTGLVFFLLMGIQLVHFARNILPVMVLLMAAAGTMAETLYRRLPKPVRTWGASRLGFSPAAGLLVLLPLVPALLAMPSLLQAPSPSGKAKAQAWFDRAAATTPAREVLDELSIAAESYTVYLDPERWDVDYYRTITDMEEPGVGEDGRRYDVVILGAGMYRRFYRNPDVYREEVGIYDSYFEAPGGHLVFRGREDPLDFRQAGGRVDVLFPTPRGRALMDAMSPGDGD